TPLIVELPDVGFTRPSSIRSVVVLPAPFGPRKPVTEPGSTLKLKWSTARTWPPKTLVNAVATIRPYCGTASDGRPSMGAADWLIQASKHVELGARCQQ